MATTALARRMESVAMVRWKAVTRGEPVTMARRLSHIAARVLTFIPPPVDCEPPPAHMRKSIMTSVTLRKPSGLTELNPALRGTAELNTDWVIFSIRVMPRRELEYSSTKNSTVPATNRSMKVKSTIFVFMLN